MTLILSLATRWYALQVGDRLLTQRVGSGPAERYDPWDSYANKAIILHARDALVVMSYSGQGHVDGLPTDDWLAKVLFGEDPSPIRDGRRGQRIGPAPRVWTLGKYLVHVTQELNTARRGDRLQGSFGINFTGLRWQRRNSFPLPCLGHIKWNTSTEMFRCDVSKRFWGWESNSKNTRVMALGRSEVKAERLLADSLDGQDISDADEHPEQIMTDLVRHIADEDTSVGRDCMAILIKPTAPHVRVRYRPYFLDKVPLALRTDQVDVHGVSPWIMTPSLTAPPSVIVGQGWSIQAGNLVIHLDAPEAGTSIKAVGTQPRKRWP
jgi:hypothetical protein